MSTCHKLDNCQNDRSPKRPKQVQVLHQHGVWQYAVNQYSQSAKIEEGKLKLRILKLQNKVLDIINNSDSEADTVPSYKY